jgi:hypothetical protein
LRSASNLASSSAFDMPLLSDRSEEASSVPRAATYEIDYPTLGRPC